MNANVFILGKSVRRRAASMETSKYEKRRGRAKKRVEQLRSAGLGLGGMSNKKKKTNCLQSDIVFNRRIYS